MGNQENISNDFLSEIEKQGIPINPQQKQRIRDKINSILNYQPTVGVFGKTGVGKSSMCNALFGKDIAEISDVGACTRKPQEILLNIGGKQGLKLLDVPGVGESEGRESEYSELYKKLLPELDIILWVLKADDRAYSVDETYYKTIVKPHLDEKKPFFIIINQVDKIEPFREWNMPKREPGNKQAENIKLKKQNVSNQFNYPLSKIIEISANEKYNLVNLIDEIIHDLPKDKKISFAKNVEKENVSQEAKKEAEKGFWESVDDLAEAIIPGYRSIKKVGKAIYNIWNSIFG